MVAVVRRPLTRRDIQASLQGLENAFGDMRQAKGVAMLGREVLPPKRIKPAHGAATEHQEQVAVIHWWRHAHKFYQLAEWRLFAVPNAAQRSPAQGAWMKAEGLRAGIPDLMLAVPRNGEGGLFMELKVRPNGRVSPEQREIHGDFAEHYRVAVCWTADEAIAEIKAYLA